MSDATRQIEIGDVVEVIYIPSGIVSGTVVNVPRGAGDMWQIRDGEYIHAINPYCSGLESIRCHVPTSDATRQPEPADAEAAPEEATR